MKKLRIFYFALIVPVLLFSQTREISGKVLDENNQPLPGASIVLKLLAFLDTTLANTNPINDSGKWFSVYCVLMAEIKYVLSGME